MQVATAWLKIDSTGSNIQLSEVTPAEAAILNADHEANAKGVAVHDVVVTGIAERSGEAEINRLREKYANAKNKKGEQWATVLYPGKSPMLPQTFKEVGLEAVELKATTNKKTESAMAGPTTPPSPTPPAASPPTK